MKTIAIVNQKGGSGKSTLAECICVAAHLDGKPSAILDLDPQGTAYAWGRRREDGNPPVLSVTPANYRDEWQRLKDAGAEFVVIDTPARLQDTVLSAAGIADLIIVPAKPTINDIERVEASIKLACTEEAKPAFVVFNQVRPQQARAEQAEQAIAKQRFPVCPVRIGYRVEFEDAAVTGQTPQETQPKGKAAEEIGQLYRYVFKLLKQLERGPVDMSTGRPVRKSTLRSATNA